MNQIEVFKNNEFGEIRTVIVNDEPMFCLGDICRSLGIKNVTDVAKRLDEDERTRLNLGRAGEVNFVTESGLYAVVLRSDKPAAKKFRKWITSEVLPSIRKTGTYGRVQIPQTTDGKIALLAQEHTELRKEIESVRQELDDFKQDMPLLAVECEQITVAVHKRGVDALGGKGSNAYKDTSLRGKVYQDIHREIKRQFGVNTYKAIKRSQCDAAVAIIEEYELPIVLQEQIRDCNSQLSMGVA